MITKNELTLENFCIRTRVLTVWDINEVLCCNWIVQQIMVAIKSKIVKKKCRRHSFNINRDKVFNRTSYDNPTPKILYFEKHIELKKRFLTLAFKTLTQKLSQQDFLSYPIANLKFCDHISRWSFLKIKVEFYYQGTGTIACSICG